MKEYDIDFTQGSKFTRCTGFQFGAGFYSRIDCNFGASAPGLLARVRTPFYYHF